MASTNAGAIYTNSVNLMRITGNVIEDNKADDGAALFCTGGNVLFDSNTVTNNVATNTAKKVITNTGKLISTNNEFTNNTDGTDILFSETGVYDVSDNDYIANMLETTIDDIDDADVLADFTVNVTVNAKPVYNTIVDSGEVIVNLNGETYATVDVVDSVASVTFLAKDLSKENTVEIYYVDEDENFQESETSLKY